MGATIGRIVGTSDGRIEVGAGLEDVPRSRADLYPSPSPAGEGSSMSACCGSPAEPAGAAQAFGAFMRATAADGAVSARTKELVTFALVVMSRCAPCFDTHLATARGMGISDAELEEIAWCAVAMGGAPVRMFYQEMMAGKREETHGGGCCG
jgi:AhpD family alkylhydroperoxidase